MWRIRFLGNDGDWLVTRSGVHNPEAAAFYAEAILADPERYKLVSLADGIEQDATNIAPQEDYYIESYWASAPVVSI